DGSSDANVHRQTPGNQTSTEPSTPAPATDAAAPDPLVNPAVAEPPPEHAERVVRLMEMAEGIDHYVEEREDLHEKFRALPQITDEDTEQKRRSLKAWLTRIERFLEQHLRSRIEHIDEATEALEATFSGFTPAPSPAPNKTEGEQKAGEP